MSAKTELLEQLSAAIEESRVADVESLLGRSAELANETFDDGRTPLLAAIEQEAFEESHPMVKALIRSGARVDEESMNHTPLWWACQKGEAGLGIARTLIEAGANKDAVGSDGWTALHVAVNFQQAALFEELVRLGCSATASKTYPLLVYAALNADADADDEAENLRFVRRCLQLGADVSTPDVGGFTALMAAARSLNLPAVQLLLQSGADVNAVNANDQTALYLAAGGRSRSGRDPLPVVDCLLAAGARLELGERVLSAARDDAAVFGRLVAAGAVPGPADVVSGSCVLTVHRANNVKSADLNGYSDPYCVLNLPNGPQKTPIIKKTLNPSWEMGFAVPKLVIDQEITFEVWDHDKVSADDFLGQAQLYVHDFVDVVERPLELSGRPGKKDKKITGELVVSINWIERQFPQ